MKAWENYETIWYNGQRVHVQKEKKDDVVQLTNADEVAANRFFDNIRTILHSIGWTMTTLAKATGTTKQNVSNYFHKRNKQSVFAYFAFRYVIEREIKARPNGEPCEQLLKVLVDTPAQKSVRKGTGDDEI